jgi:pre-mRNA-splicing factor 18
MDLLQRELARKKSVLEKAASEHNHPKKRKYMKQSDLRRVEEEQQEEEERLRRLQKQQDNLTKRQKKNSDEVDADVSQSTRLKEPNKTTNQGTTNKKDRKGSHEDRSENEGPSSSPGKDDPSGMMTPEKLKQRLRSFGLPICFFGESLKEKLERLQAALTKQDQTLQGLSEMEEFRLGQGFGIRNPFLEKEKRDSKPVGDEGNETSKHKKNEDSNHKDEEEETEGEADDDPVKRIYKFLKGLLRDWEQDLEARPKSVAVSVAGRNESMTFKQCTDYIRPLFKQLKRRKLEAGMQAHLANIVEFAKAGEFVKAHDAYMDVAIGRAAWPIGVTMVGIHARSGRAKIESSNVAHVMNSELQRKYLTSVKRLLSYAQKKRPDVDPSKKVN